MRQRSDPQKSLRLNIGRMLAAIREAAKKLTTRQLEPLVDELKPDNRPTDDGHRTNDWWLLLLDLTPGEWSKFFGNSKDFRTLQKGHIEQFQKLLRFLGFSDAIPTETPVPDELLRALRNLTAAEFQGRQSTTPWVVIRHNVIARIEAEFEEAKAVCLCGMTGIGKTTSARQACAVMQGRKSNAKGAVVDAIEELFPSLRDLPQPRSISRLFGRLVTHVPPTHTVRISDVLVVVEEAQKHMPLHEADYDRWTAWYRDACKANSREEISLVLQKFPSLAASDANKLYLRAIASWLASFWKTSNPKNYRIVLLVDNVWNFDWVWPCLEPFCMTGSAVRILFTAQRLPPAKFRIVPIALPRLSDEQISNIVVPRVAERLLAHAPADARDLLRNDLYAEARRAFNQHKETIGQVLERVDYLPIAIVSYAAVWARDEIWRRDHRDSYWGERLRELDHALVSEELPTDFAEQLGSDNPDHRKNLYFALKLPWQLLPPSSRERYLDFAIFGRGNIIEDVVTSIWAHCPRAHELLSSFRVPDELALFEETSLLQRDEKGLRLHDLHLGLVRSILRNSENDSARNRMRDFLSAIGSLDSQGEFKAPIFPIEALGGVVRVSRADDGAPMFSGAHAREAETFLFENLAEFVRQTVGEAGIAVLESDPGFLASRGHRAAQQFRHAEAREDFDRAREFLAGISDPDGSTRGDVILRVSQARVVLEQSGYLDPRLPALLLPAIEQSVALKWEEMAIRAYFDLSLHYIVVGDIEESEKTAAKAWNFAKNSPSIARRIVGLRNTATPLLLRGEFGRAKKVLEQLLSLADQLPGDTGDNGSILDDVVLHPVVSAKATLSLLEWVFGFADQARVSAAKAIKSARELTGHNRHNTLCHSLCFAGTQMAEFLYDYQKMKEYADEALTNSQKYGLNNWEGHANLVKGWALCKLGNVSGGKALLADYIGRILGGDGSPYHIAHYLFLDADVHLNEDNLAHARKQLRTALQQGRKTGEEYWLAEVHRLQGEICIRQGKTKSAAIWLQASIDVSRRQGAKSFELRAATALARLWFDQGKTRRAKTLLSGIFEQFSEGFDAPDLIRAKELLGTLR
jgi:predicted ATPase